MPHMPPIPPVIPPGTITQIFNVRDYRAMGDDSTDDVARIQAAITAAARAANGGGVGFQAATLFVPAGIYRISAALDVPYNVSILLDPEATIKATASMDAMLRTQQDAYMRENIITGGVWDANGIATDAIWIRNARGVRVQNTTLMNVKGTGLHFGDTEAPDTSYGLYTDNVSVWRTSGAIVSGSIGIHLEGTTGDCLIRTAQLVGVETGIKISSGSGNNRVIGAHVWSFASTGSTKVGFEDNGNGNVWIGAYADTPSEKGFALGGQNAVLIGCKVYNNSIYGADNTLVGVGFTQADPVVQFAAIIGMHFKGASASHRIAKDIDAWNKSGLQIIGSQFTNVVATTASSASIDASTITASDTITANKRIALNGANSSTDRRLDIKTSGSLRWSLGADSSLESGGNAGTGFFLNSYDDTGTLIRSELFVRRTDGQWTFAGPVVLSGGAYMGSSGKLQTSGAAAPTTGAHVVGEIVWNTAPAAGGKVGWVCTAAGTPGTWKAFGSIDP